MVATNVTLFIFAAKMQGQAHAVQMREKRKNMNKRHDASRLGQGPGYSLLQIGENMGHRRPGGVLGILSFLGITKTLKDARKWEAGSEVMDTRENGDTDNFDDAFSLRRQPVLRHPKEGSKLLQRVRVPESNL
jgi:hypothetical protein